MCRLYQSDIEMKLFSGILLMVANLLLALGKGAVTPPPSDGCHYSCPVLGAQPVCGSDGRTYPSQCHVECISRKQGKTEQVSVSVKGPGRCPEQPCLCTAIGDPVCGSNGRTYSNPCELGCASRKQQRYGLPAITIKSKGKCPDEGCFCPAVVQPVCGTDVRTYGNACELGCESRRLQRLGYPPIFVASNGVCPSSICNCPLVISSVCGTDGRSYRNVCFLECASRINQGNGLPPVFIRSYGVCAQENCLCPADISPVCASDGNTYNNICTLKCQNGRRFALGQAPLTILHNGACKDCICPLNYDPVCGSDGKTYGNTCQLGCENQRRKDLGLPPLTYTKGECGCICPAVYQPVCASDFKTYGNLCLLGCENRRRVHNGLPPLTVVSEGECGCNCSDVRQPVCGSDNRTYTNICQLNCENFYRIRNGLPVLYVLRMGPC